MNSLVILYIVAFGLGFMAFALYEILEFLDEHSDEIWKK